MIRCMPGQNRYASIVSGTAPSGFHLLSSSGHGRGRKQSAQVHEELLNEVITKNKSKNHHIILSEKIQLHRGEYHALLKRENLQTENSGLTEIATDIRIHVKNKIYR